jgi:hypothetical protein
VQEILISTALRVAPTEKDWKTNSEGLSFNHKLGAGLVDASAAVAKATTWRTLGAATSVTIAKKNLALSGPDAQPTGSVIEFDLTDAAKKVPAPKDSAVTMDEPPAGRFAVYRYSGGRNEANEQEALSKLRAWVDKRRLEVEGEPMFGYYDPPWIPPFMRRNEVMLHVDGTQP